MAGKIQGSFPGGPKKSVPAAERTKAPRLSRVEDIEHRSAARSEARSHARRRKRFWSGFVFSLAVGGAVGLYFGKQSQTTLEEIQAEQPSVLDGMPGDMDMSGISSEVNRTLLELWKMEDIEYQRNSR